MDDVPISQVPRGTKIFNSYMLTLRKALGGGKWKAKARWVCDGRGAVPGVHTPDVNFGSHLPPWLTVRMLLAKAGGSRLGSTGWRYQTSLPQGEEGQDHLDAVTAWTTTVS